MWKTVLAGATALALAGGSMVYAQQRGDAGRHHHGRLSAQDISAYTDARIAALKAGLQLTAEQEKNWPALEKALRDGAKARSERFAARASADKPRDPIERLRLRADMISQRGASLKEIADAAAPLYQSLDDAKKRRFTVIAQITMGRFGQHHHRGHHHHGDRGHEMMHDDAGAGTQQPQQQ